MTLYLTALDLDNTQREFSCGLISLETSFDFLNHIVARGHTLVKAYILDGSSRTELPVMAFDGLPSLAATQALEREWQAVLASLPLTQSVHCQEMIALTRRRINGYALHIAAQERMITWLTTWLHRTQEKTLTEPMRSRLTGQYESQLGIHKAQRDKLLCGARLAMNRLNQLTI
ncbi:MAG: hypothetical protein EOO39_26395 [Cytophagaceae bacterium]|nr:MAG: hypothetical protein EOO39_26395 [Cytophagaceae bacterium]